jgi:hypothetical protein
MPELEEWEILVEVNSHDPPEESTYHEKLVGITSFTKFIATTAQQLDTKVYNHVTSLLRVSGFFGHLQGIILQRKHNVG